MSPQVAVITCVRGEDTVKPVRTQTVPVDWVLIADREPESALAAGWRVVIDPDAGTAPKIRPWEYTDAPASVWLNQAFRVTSGEFVETALGCAGPIAQFKHPWRDCLYDEAATVPKYDPQERDLVLDQVAAYRRAGHPEHWGLWATGVIARRHTKRVKRFGDIWSQSLALWSTHDQVSEPYALRLAELFPVSLPGWYRENEWVAYEGKTVEH